ncbi:MAG: beta-galactosidase, partial [candidate division FCPU426 bacterium]
MKITFDSKSFMADGERRLILSGEVHYFRTPRAEWKTVLQEAKNCGLNAISTYIPWNFHEVAEGKWNFKDDHDLEAFLKLCKQLKLWVIAKPGPYVRAEWNFGGFPAWLHAKGVRHFRTSDLTYMNAVDRYLDKVLPILAKNQLNRGGSVFLVQIEDTFDEAPQDPAYLRHLENKFKKRLTVPVYFSLGDTSLGGGHVKGALIAACAYDRPSAHLARIRELANSSRQPLMISQFWTGRYTQWGSPRQPRKTKQVENRLNECLSAGACLINQTMFFGGTNFGEWAGRGVGGDRAFVTTSYDYDAPLSEGLKKTPKALALGLWARWAKGLAPALMGSEVVKADHPVIPAEVSVVARANGDSKIYFLHNATKDTLTGKIQVDDAIPFSMAPGEQRVFAYNIPLTPNLSVRASSHPYYYEHLGMRTVVVLWGEPGQKVSFYGSGTLDVTERSNENILLEHERKGFMLSAEIGNRPQKLLAKILFEAGKREVLFLIITRSLAEQTSFDAERQKLVIGSAEVDFDHKVARLPAGSQTLITATATHYDEQYVTVGSTEEKSAKLGVTGALDEAALLQRLKARKDWKEAVAGKDLAEYGFSSSRAWYKVVFNAREKGKRTMIIPSLEDQFAVFLNDAYLGIYGRLGKGLDLELQVKQGENTLLLLASVMGRYSFGAKLGDKKGLIAPIFDNGEVQSFSEGWHFLEAAGPLDFKIFSSPTFTGRGWEIGALEKTLLRTGYVCARKKFKVPEWARRVRLNLHAGDVNIQVALNGDLLGQHPDKLGSQYHEFELTPYLIKEENTVALFFKGPTSGFQHSELLFLGPELKCKMEVCEGVYAPDETEALKDKGWSKTKKGRYGFWRGSFKSPNLKQLESVWIKPAKNGRGSLWV